MSRMIEWRAVYAACFEPTEIQSVSVPFANESSRYGTLHSPGSGVDGASVEESDVATTGFRNERYLIVGSSKKF
jgi:hypothetical protein